MRSPLQRASGLPAGGFIGWRERAGLAGDVADGVIHIRFVVGGRSEHECVGGGRRAGRRGLRAEVDLWPGTVVVEAPLALQWNCAPLFSRLP